MICDVEITYNIGPGSKTSVEGSGIRFSASLKSQNTSGNKE